MKTSTPTRPFHDPAALGRFRARIGKALVVGAILGAVTAARAETFQVFEDTYSTGAQITKAAGTAGSLLVGPKNTAYISFDLTNLSFGAPNVTAARLTLYFPTVSAAGTLEISANSSAFSEILKAATPAPTQIPGSIASVAITTADKQQFLVVDVTAQVQAWLSGSNANDGFAISSSNGAVLTIGAKEGPATGYPAELEMDVAPSSLVGINAVVSGSLMAGTFFGNGNGLTNLNATELLTGTVPLARLPGAVLTNAQTNVTLSGAFAGTFAGTATSAATAVSAGSATLAYQLVSGATLTNVAISNSVFQGDGSGLTNINASQISSGSVALAQLPPSVVTNGASGLTLAGIFSGTLAGSATSAVTAINAGTATYSYHLYDGAAINEALVTNSTFAGDGSAITNLNASEITSGTLSAAALPAGVVTNGGDGTSLSGVALLAGANTFTSSNIFNGAVGIGTSTPGVPLDVVGATYQGTTNGYLYQDGGYGAYSGGNDPSIRASGTIQAYDFYAVSDARTKQPAGQSDAAADLATLNKIKVTDYTYIDKVVMGAGVHKKVIAQELEQVYPQAVGRSVNYIPNVYATAERVESAGGAVRFTMAKPHGLSAGDKVRWIDEKGAFQHSVVAKVDSATAFEIAGAAAPAKAFIYGKEVSDFRTVDYEAITMLNVSATQELARQLDEQKAENGAMRADLARLKKMLTQLAQENRGGKFSATATTPARPVPTTVSLEQ